MNDEFPKWNEKKALLSKIYHWGFSINRLMAWMTVSWTNMASSETHLMFQFWWPDNVVLNKSFSDPASHQVLLLHVLLCSVLKLIEYWPAFKQDSFVLFSHSLTLYFTTGFIDKMMNDVKICKKQGHWIGHAMTWRSLMMLMISLKY